MIDRSTLGAWIQPQHLEDDALEAYRTKMANHPGRLILVEDLLVDDKAEKLSRFLHEEAEFRTEFGLYSAEAAVTEEEWQRADDEDRMFRLRRLSGIPPQFQFSPNALTYLQFRQALQQPAFAEFFQALTGLDLGTSEDFGVQSMKPGDYLRSHSDDVRDRRIALVIYLSPGWRSEFGGTLVMTDRDGNSTRVDPGYNSMVVFDVLADSMHLVEPIAESAGDATRFTIGGWYPKPA